MHVHVVLHTCILGVHVQMYLTIDLISSSYPKENNRSASSTTRSSNVSLISSVYGEEEHVIGYSNQHYMYT